MNNYKFNEILKEVKETIVMEDEKIYSLASVRRRNGGIFHRENKKGKDILTKTLSKVIPGSFLISRMQVVHGACTVVPFNIGEMYISGSYTSLVPREPIKIDLGYLNQYAHTRQSYDSFLKSSHGIHIEKMTFSLDRWLNREIELPDIPKQREIVKVLEEIENAIFLSEQKKSKLSLLKKSITDDIFT